MELIRYRPGEAIRWLQTGAEKSRKDAKQISGGLVVPDSMRSLGENVKVAAGALMAVGKSAITDLVHRQAAASEYVLDEGNFEIIRPGSTRRYAYADVISMTTQGDRSIFDTEQGHFTIRPYAYVVAGRLKVPVGWSRNGTEVPFELLVEELAARCGIDVD